ncbi:MAG: glycoside hydrolase family 3 N-terminal domain-containing protein [Bacteroidota bacterium]
MRNFIAALFFSHLVGLPGVSLLVMLMFLSPACFTLEGLYCQENTLLPYRNPAIPIDNRVNDLVSRMTLEEKAAQLDMYWGREVAEGGVFSETKAQTSIGAHGIGSVHDLYPSTAEVSNQIQRFALEHTRLGIPVLFIEEGLHGYLGKGSTTFPQSIGLACTWDTALVGSIGSAIATEARAHGVHMELGPVLDLARDPRWGRTEETYGEDPFLDAQIGLAMVKGLQGDDLTSDHSIIAEPKHFAMHGVPESGSNTAPVSIGEREERESYLSVFETAIRKGGALGVMAAYHELDGIPCVSNRWLLTEILRNEWGFRGFVLSDLGAVAMQISTHRTAATPRDAIVQAISAGLDMQFYDFDHEVFQKSIVEAVHDGLLPATALDRAVGDVLRVKFLLGLFDSPYTDVTLIHRRVRSVAHRDLAKKAADESLCLLQNRNALLPLSRGLKSIAVIGPLANVSALGDYSPAGAVGVSVLQALRAKYGTTMKIRYEAGALPNTFLSVVEPNALRTKDLKHNGLTGEYFNNPDLQGTPAVSRVDTLMAPYWDVGSPAPSVKRDSFSVRWTGALIPPVSGTYELGIITDDKGRLFWNDSLIVDNWKNFQVNVMMTGRVSMVGGKAYPLRLEYAELTGYAGIRFQWRLIHEDSVDRNSPVSRAVAAAKESDVAVAVLGETDDVVGEGKDRTDLDLDAHQEKLLKAVYQTGTPTVVVLLNGRPLSINWCAENIPAIIEAWYPGEAGGTAIVDALFGDVNPSGKLPISFPRTVGQLPDYYDHKPSAKRSYVDADGRNLYAFGHGLSYTTFQYSHLRIEPATCHPGETVTVTLDVKNSGTCGGEDVVQCYLVHPVSSVTTPVLALKGFARVALHAGESKSVELQLPGEEFAIWNREMKRVVEPGEFQILVGHASDDIRLKGRVAILK